MSQKLTRRDFLLTSMGLGAGLFILGPGNWTPASALTPGAYNGYPRALSFRQPEWDFRTGGPSYEEWESRYLPLDGLVGKVLNEAHDYTGRNNLPFFLRYSRSSPLLARNGSARGTI